MYRLIIIIVKGECWTINLQSIIGIIEWENETDGWEGCGDPAIGSWGARQGACNGASQSDVADSWADHWGKK